MYMVVGPGPPADGDAADADRGGVTRGVLELPVREVLAAHRQARAKPDAAEREVAALLASTGGAELAPDSAARGLLPSLLDIDGGGVATVDAELAAFLIACLSDP